MAPATDLAAKLVAEVKEVCKSLDDLQTRQKERMVASMTRQESKSVPNQQQLSEKRQSRHERPMSTQTLTVKWSCRLSTFSRLPLP
jgi:hypothetical protein